MSVTAFVILALAQAPSDAVTLRGRVLDAAGRPVVAALVFQSGDRAARPEIETGADGRFELLGARGRPNFLFVRKAGYRFGGTAVAPQGEEVSLTIHKMSEPPVLTRKALPPTLPRQEEIALARRLCNGSA